MIQNKRIRVFLFSVLGVFLGIVLLNVIVNSLISNKLKNLLNVQKIEHYKLSVEKIRFSFFDRSLLLKEVTFRPSDTAMIGLKAHTLDKTSLNVISSSSVKIKGIHLFAAIFSKNIVVNRLIINDLLVQRFNSASTIKQKSKGSDENTLNLDSLFVQEINGFELRHIQMKNMKVQFIDVTTGDLTFQNNPFNFEVSGFKLAPKGGQYFSLEPVKKDFEIAKIKIEIPDKKYLFAVDKIRFDFQNDHICIEGLTLKPSIEKETLASTYKYNSDIYDLGFKKACFYHLDLEKAETGNGIFVDSVKIEGFDIGIFKDKTKPFNTAKRPKLPHNALKNLDLPLHIPKLEITGGNLFYEEKLQRGDITMKVRMQKLHLKAENVTSIKAHRQHPLKVDLFSQFMDKTQLNVHLILPLQDEQDNFQFFGDLSGSSFSYYDDAIIPALGLKVLTGTMDGLKFEAQGSSYSSNGTMTMLYSDLKTEVLKSKKNEKSGFLSWSVNSLVHKSNPGQNGQVRVGIMSFDRVLYKGMGNYLWKTLQSGIVNTIAPFGTTQQKENSKKERQQNREKRKKERDTKS